MTANGGSDPVAAGGRDAEPRSANGSLVERREHFQRAVEGEAMRRREAQRLGHRSFWETVGLLGAIGWVVVLPAVGGAYLGRWLDAGSGRLTWTLLLLLIGLGGGGYTAWTMLWRR